MEKRYAALHNRPDPLADGQAGEHQARVASLNGSSHATARVHPLASTTAKPPSACAALAPSRNISVIAHVDHGKVCFTHHRFPLSFLPGPDSRPSLRRRVPPFLAPPEYPEDCAEGVSLFICASKLARVSGPLPHRVHSLTPSSLPLASLLSRMLATSG